MRPNILFLAMPFALFPGQAQAQLPIVDIGMVPLENGQLELRLRPDADFDGLFSSLTVSVRRDEASVATIGDFTVNPTYADCISLYYSESVADGGYIYDFFAGFGFSSLLDQGTNWVADQEFVLGHFEVINGPSTFRIMQICPPNSQGNYYVSLNSEDRTGIVYEISTSTADHSSDVVAITISPNPSGGPSRLDIGTELVGPVSVQIVDAAGRLVKEKILSSSTLVIDATEFAPGSYLVRVKGPSISRTVPWVVQKP